MTALVSASGLTKRFGQRSAVEALTFDIYPGEIFALLGPNGAGKTTTLRMLAGLIAPSAGTARVRGITVERRTVARVHADVGLLAETPGLWERLSVGTNLRVYADLYALPGADARVETWLRRFSLWDRRHEDAATLSRGMKQKVALARALLHDPPVVLLDEPTAGLDPQTVRSLRDVILELRARGRAVVLSTHNLDEAERLADRVAVLNRTLLASDTTDRLRQRLFGHRIRVVLSTDARPFAASVEAAGGHDVEVDGRALSVAVAQPSLQTPPIVRALVEAGASVQSVTEQAPPLEEIYFRLIGEASRDRT